MHSIGDIMKEMHIAPPLTTSPIEAKPALVTRLRSRLQEYSCGQLNEEDYMETTNPWEEWPYSWVRQLNDFARHRFHSFHQNHSVCTDTQLSDMNEHPEYSVVTAKAA